MGRNGIEAFRRPLPGGLSEWTADQRSKSQELHAPKTSAQVRVFGSSIASPQRHEGSETGTNCIAFRA
jgi:hypothetical protein